MFWNTKVYLFTKNPLESNNFHTSVVTTGRSRLRNAKNPNDDKNMKQRSI